MQVDNIFNAVLMVFIGVLITFILSKIMTTILPMLSGLVYAVALFFTIVIAITLTVYMPIRALTFKG